MFCLGCGNDMLIKKSHYEVLGDNSAETETQVNIRHCFICVNKDCGEYERERMGEGIKLV